jgi:hypothetical protein
MLAAALALITIAASVAWTWHTQFQQPPFNTALQQGIGEALAARTRAALPDGGRILVVTLETDDSPALNKQFEAFKTALRHPRNNASTFAAAGVSAGGPSPHSSQATHPSDRSQTSSPEIEIDEIERLDADKKAKYGPGTGLSASRLLRLASKNQDLDAIVSFVGLPDLDPKELASLGTNGPRLIAFSRNLKKLGPLLHSRRLEAAAVPRFQFPSPISGEPRTPGEWFDLQCQWITPADIVPSP